MERDARRSRGQWRGCHTFQDIVCDGDQSFISPKRTGGLRMGQTYYYYVSSQTPIITRVYVRTVLITNNNRPPL